MSLRSFSLLSSHHVSVFFSCTCFNASYLECFFLHRPLGIAVTIGDFLDANFSNKDFCGALFQYPDTEGQLMNPDSLRQQIAEIKDSGVSGLTQLFWKCVGRYQFV